MTEKIDLIQTLNFFLKNVQQTTVNFCKISQNLWVSTERAQEKFQFSPSLSYKLAEINKFVLIM